MNLRPAAQPADTLCMTEGALTESAREAREQELSALAATGRELGGPNLADARAAAAALLSAPIPYLEGIYVI